MIQRRRSLDCSQNLVLPVILDLHNERNHQHNRTHRESNWEGDMFVCKHEVGRNVFYLRVNDCSKNAYEESDRERQEGQQNCKRKYSRRNTNPSRLPFDLSHKTNVTPCGRRKVSPTSVARPFLAHLGTDSEPHQLVLISSPSVHLPALHRKCPTKTGYWANVGADEVSRSVAMPESCNKLFTVCYRTDRDTNITYHARKITV
jgi:hypothetical protein